MLFRSSVPFETERKELVKNINEFAYKTPEQLEQERKAGVAQYEQERPFRYGFMQEDINKMKKDIEGRRESNINEALMQAGLSIMGSRSPYALQAVSEGGLSGLSAYRQGKKDILEGEKELRQSQAAYAQAQDLYDERKYAAGDKKKDRKSTRLNSSHT